MTSSESILQMSSSGYNGLSPNSGMPGYSGGPSKFYGNPLPGGNQGETVFTHNTHIQKSHDDNRSNTIRTLFIVGTRSIRLCLLRNRSNTHKILIASGTLIADASISLLNNTINDPNYIKSHIKSCQTIRREYDALIVKIDPTTE